MRMNSKVTYSNNSNEKYNRQNRENFIFLNINVKIKL